MGLNIRRLGAEKLLCPVDGYLLNYVNIFTAAVISLAGVTLGVFVCEHAAHCGHNRGGNDIFGRDKLEIVSLPFKLKAHGIGYFAVVFADKSNGIKVI